MITFGLTGGIACGKSTVTKTFRSHNIPMVDADQVARDVVVVGSFGWGMIRAMFGHEYLNKDDSLNREKLAVLVFSDKQALFNMNAIMGPLINMEAHRQIKTLHDNGSPIVGYDAALICEMGNADKYRPLIVVSCPEDMQLTRLMSRNSLTREQAMARINAQMPVAQKAAMADYIIDTSGTIENSVQQTESIIQILKGKV